PEIVIQSLASGLLMGLLYGLIAVGLALIFGLMDIVNFAHGEFLMAAMYATFGLAVALLLDPLLSAPIVAAALFAFGALIYRGLRCTLFPDQSHRFRPRARSDPRGFRRGGAGRHRSQSGVCARLGIGGRLGRARRRRHGDLLLYLSRRRRLLRADRLCHGGAR